MAHYAWIITKDMIRPTLGPDFESAVGVAGPHGATAEQVEKASNGHRFRMLDDDGIPYFEGKLWVSDGADAFDSEYGFGPLDDYGAPDSGCTEIQYWRAGAGGGWETL